MMDVANHTKQQCENFSLCSVKVCWWVFVGMFVSCILSGSRVKIWKNQTQKVVKQTLQVQQQRQLLLKQQQLAQGSSKVAGKWRKKLLIIFVFVGVIISIWLFWHLNKDINLRRREALTNMCDERARMLQDQFNVSMNHVHALAILVSTFHHRKHPSAIDQVLFPSS